MCLDPRRLNKQITEAEQILKALDGTYTKGWIHHPAVLMWKGYENALKEYINVLWDWWMEYYAKNDRKNGKQIIVGDVEYPLWFGLPEFHISHKSNLLRKDYEYYSRYNWNVPSDIEYFWPTKEGYVE